ncbi:uncharacterized protein LOC135810309 [Sycon ciliatum]|uniref:uncharacterized protein LOC135810309 n=1 Tax=Sycon ciliatum TaxID=27933 RepID=UPI0031F65702
MCRCAVDVLKGFMVAVIAATLLGRFEGSAGQAPPLVAGDCRAANGSVFQSFANVIDADALGGPVLNSSSLLDVEFLIYQNNTYAFPSWLKLIPGSSSSSSSGGTSQLTASSAPDHVIVYGTPAYIDGNSMLNLQVRTIDKDTLDVQHGNLCITIQESTRNYSNLYRVLYPLQALTRSFISANTAPHLASLLGDQLGVTLQVYALARPREHGLVVRASVNAPEGLLMTVALSGNANEVIQVNNALQQKLCTTGTIRSIVSAAVATDYCFVQQVATTPPSRTIAGLQAVPTADALYQPLAYDTSRRDHRGAFAAAIAVSAVFCFVMLLVYIFGNSSPSQRYAITATDSRQRSASPGSRHKSIHAATVRLRHMTSASHVTHERMYDDVTDEVIEAPVKSSRHYSGSQAAVHGSGVVQFSNPALFGDSSLDATDGVLRQPWYPRQPSSADTLSTSQASGRGSVRSSEADTRHVDMPSSSAGVTGSRVMTTPRDAFQQQGRSSIHWSPSLSPRDAGTQYHHIDDIPSAAHAHRSSGASSNTGQRTAADSGMANGRPTTSALPAMQSYATRSTSSGAAAAAVAGGAAAPLRCPPPYVAPLIDGIHSSATPAHTSNGTGRNSGASALSSTTSQIDELLDEINELEVPTLLS